MESKHSEGYWLPGGGEPVKNPLGTFQMAILQAETNNVIAFSFGNTPEECEANAVLISASPLLFSYVSEKAKLGDPLAQKIYNVITNGRK